MTGPEHYREAERLIDVATDTRLKVSDATRDCATALAQVHATLAQTAATIEAAAGGRWDAWVNPWQGGVLCSPDERGTKPAPLQVD